MLGSMVLANIAARAAFAEERMGKAELAAGAHLYAGLNCFRPGQEHASHVHPGQDKLYYILEGGGEAQVGPERRAVRAGDLVLAPAGVAHAMRNTGSQPLVVLVVFAPPPAR